jgi:hypothetical protein
MAVKEVHKGEAGLGGRGKNKPTHSQNQATRKKVGLSTKPANLTRASDTPRWNQKRNQQEWHSAKQMKSRY